MREDAENGRIYLPAEDLRRFGVGQGDGVEPDGGGAQGAIAIAPAGGGEAGETGGAMAQRASRLAAQAAVQAEPLSELMRFEAERAQQWFDRGLVLVPLLDRRSGACVSAMAGIYRRLLERIEADPAARSARALRCSTGEKAVVALRSFAGRGS